MAKSKNENKKNQSFYKAIKPYLSNKRVLYSVLGVAGAALAVGSIGKNKRQALVDAVANSVKGFINPAADTNRQPDQNLVVG